MNQRARYFDSSGRQIAEHDALDRNGILRSGFAIRVPMQMRDASRQDAKPVVVDGHGNGGLALRRPGYRIATNDTRRALVADAYAQADRQAGNSWKMRDGDQLCPDCDGEGYDEDGTVCDGCGGDGLLPEQERARASSNFGSGNEGGSSDASTMLRDQAYQSYDNDLANAWRSR